MKQLTYNERVQALAEKMFCDTMNIQNEDLHYKIGWGLFKDNYLQSARIAVAEMADEIRGLLQYVTAWADCEIQDELIKRGLIPDDGQAIEPNFEKAIRETVEGNNGQEAGKS